MHKRTRALTASEQSLLLAALFHYKARWDSHANDGNREAQAYRAALDRLTKHIKPGSIITIRR